MRWIAAQYGMKLKPDYKIPSSCLEPKGDKNDLNQQSCRVMTDYFVDKNVILS